MSKAQELGGRLVAFLVAMKEDSRPRHELVLEAQSLVQDFLDEIRRAPAVWTDEKPIMAKPEVKARPGR
jgi:hypothetical protein